MFFEFKAPKDIEEKSKSTKIQWSIFILLQFLINLIIFIAGIFFLLGIGTPTEAIIIGVIIFSFFMIFLILKVQRDLKLERELKNAIDKIQKQIIRKRVPVQIKDKTYYINIEYFPPNIPTKEEEEQEHDRIIENIIDNAFSDMTIVETGRT